MRFFLKYKKYSKLRAFVEIYPRARLLKFKRAKWKILQKILVRKQRKGQVFFKNNFNTFLKSKKIKNYSRYFKESLILKRELFAFYGDSLSHKYFRSLLVKTFVSHKKRVLSCFCHPLFFLDVFLWKAGFFDNTFSVRQQILSHKILVNNKRIFLGYRLQKGDIISFAENLQTPLLKNTLRVCSYAEIDVYANKIVLLKDFNALSLPDLLIIFKEFIDLKKVAYFLAKIGD